MSNLDPEIQPQRKIHQSLQIFQHYFSAAQEDLMMGILHPGGGQYYCLSLMNASRPVLMLNLLGTSANASGASSFVDSNVWENCDRIGPRTIAEQLFERSQVECGASTALRQGKVAMLQHMINLFEEHLDQDIDFWWGFVDSPDFVGSNFQSFPPEFPHPWQDLKSVASKYYDWSGNIIRIVLGEETLATYNQATAEMLDSNGKLHSFA